MTRDDVTIRRYRESEAAALWEVFATSVRVLAAADYTPEQIAAWAADDRPLSAWEERMRCIQPFVAEIDGSAVAYADVQADGYIDHFFVAPGVARQGVGSALMHRLHEEAAALELPRLYSHVSLTARPFFERWGFAVVEKRTVEVRSVTMHNFLMTKSLA